MICIDYSQIGIATILADLPPNTVLTVDLGRHLILNAIRSYKMKFSKLFGDIVIAVDSRNYWRKQAFRYYKANRKRARDDSHIDWDSVFEVLALVKQELSEYFPYPVIEVNGAEGDDVIATLAKYSQTHDLIDYYFEDENVPAPFLIISGDHDFQQLQKYPNVKQFIPLKKEFAPQVDPNRILKEHIIRGDAGDGVPNFLSDDDTFVDPDKKQYPIRTASLESWFDLSLNEVALAGYKQLEKSYENICKKCRKTHVTPPNKNFSLEGLQKNLERNKSLVDLSNVPRELEEQIIQNYEQQKGNTDTSKLFNYFIKHDLNKLLESIGDF